MTIVDAPSFHLDEFLHSQTAQRKGISNAPTPAHLENITRLLAPGMQRVRDLLRVPVLISSGYRSLALNRAVGGSATSQHCEGLAADFTAPAFGSPRRICEHILANASEIRFDQLIYEGTWVHISFVAAAPRHEVLTAHFGGGRVTYSRGLA